MMTFEMSYPKTVTWGFNPITRKNVPVITPMYSPEQYASLEILLQEALGEAFASFVVIEETTDQRPTVSYNGPVVDDVEQNLNDLIDPAWNTWALEVG